MQDYRECNGVTIDGIAVQSTAYWNNDGLDITDSKNVRITNCFINASDDALCFKSDNPKASCENVYVDNCTLRSSANGLKFGTSNYGGFRNFKITNLTIFDTYRSAIALESVDGGFMDHIDIRNVTAKNTGNAIFIRRGHRNKTSTVSTLNNIYIANVKVEVPLFKPDQGYPIEGPPDHLNPGFDKMPPQHQIQMIEKTTTECRHLAANTVMKMNPEIMRDAVAKKRLSIYGNQKVNQAEQEGTEDVSNP